MISLPLPTIYQGASLPEKKSLLAVFAHPDDESLAAGGTLAKYAAEGWRTSLICATRGEWGPISDDSLADYENLGEVRERELRAACEMLGISRLEFLELDDGGVTAILGTPEEERVVEKIAQTIRELEPKIVITFGPDGLYGHDDHIAIGKLTTRACQRIAGSTPAPELYYATAPHGYYSNLIDRLKKIGSDAHLWGIPPEQFGVSPEEITTVIDVAPFLGRKLAALRCHRTQLDEKHAFTYLTAELAAEHFNFEFFRRGSRSGQ